MVVARREAEREETASLVRDAGAQCEVAVGDVTEASIAEEPVALTEATLGPVEMLVANAGLLGLGALADIKRVWLPWRYRRLRWRKFGHRVGRRPAPRIRARQGARCRTRPIGALDAPSSGAGFSRAGSAAGGPRRAWARRQWAG